METNDQQRKAELLQENAKQKEAIQMKIHSLQTDVLHRIKVGIVIGFVGFGGYWIVRRLLGENITMQELFVNKDSQNATFDEGEEQKHTSVTTQNDDWDLVKDIKREMAKFVIAVVRIKLQELIQTLTQPKDEAPDYEEEKNP